MPETWSETAHPNRCYPSRMIAEILTPVALDQTYSYAVPDGLALQPGDVVQIPFGPRDTVGVVWELRPSNASASNLKSVAGLVPAPRLSAELRKFVDWVARYTLAPRGAVLRMTLRLPDADRAERIQVGVRLAGPPPERVTPARARVIAAAEGGLVFPKRALAEAAGVSSAVIDGLIDEGTLEAVGIAPPAIAPRPDPDHAKPALEDTQAEAAARLVEDVAAKAFAVSLLEGVTGSGKTEVYFEAVAEAVRQGRQSIILMPEIALTATVPRAFRAAIRRAAGGMAFGNCRRGSASGPGAAIASGEALVVAGARSALFLPFRDLGLIIVDEEHEDAYKQEDGVHYHARDMAVVRGRIEAAPGRARLRDAVHRNARQRPAAGATGT